MLTAKTERTDVGFIHSFCDSLLKVALLAEIAFRHSFHHHRGGFKLAAAKKILNQNRKGADKKADVLETLIGVRSELQALKKQLDYLQ